MTATAYLSCMAVINGAKSVDEVAKTLRAGFGKVLRVRAVDCSCSLQHEVTTLELTDYVDDVARVHRLRAAVLAAGDVGAVLQLHAVPHWGACAWPPSVRSPLITRLGQTYFNTKLKKMRLDAEAKAKKDKEDKKNDS